MGDAAEKRLEQWTEALYQAHRDRVQIPGPSGSYGELSLHDAYEVQAPWSDPEHIRAGDFFGMGLEPEIGIVLERPLRGPGVTNVDVLSAAAGVVAAVEILDGRILEGTSSLADGMADNAFHGGSVLGTLMVPARGFDFLHEGVIVRKNGKLVGSACGVEALGNPLSVVSWLANELARHDRQIDAGHVVSTGSLTKILPAAAGDVIEMSFAHLGCIRFAIEE